MDLTDLNWMFWWIVLLTCSAFFSGSETALFSLPRERVIELRKKNSSISNLMSVVEQNPGGLLVAILFGNLVVNILFFSMSTVMAHQLSMSIGIGSKFFIGATTLLSILLFGEMIPKALGISFSEKIIRFIEKPIYAWFRFLGPFRISLEKISNWMTPTYNPSVLTPIELKMLIESTTSGQGFGNQEKVIVEEIINLPETRVRSLMVPRVHQKFWNIDWTVEEAINYLADHPLEILPVFKNKEDQLIGYVEASVIFAQLDKKITLSELIEPLIFVPETMRADCMLEQFMKQSVHMVAVVDEYGGLSGTLTIDNLLHDVVGEFDWRDTSPVESLGDSTYRLEGRLSVKEWRNLFVGYIPAQVVDELALDTLSGLVISLLKRIPRVGDVVKLGNLSFTVDRVRGNRIESVLLKLDSNEVTQ